MNVLKGMLVPIVTQFHYAVDHFILVNVFLSTLSLLRREEKLKLTELPRLYLRKWAKLALFYYPIWLMTYCIVPAIMDGPFSYTLLSGIEEC